MTESPIFRVGQRVEKFTGDYRARGEVRSVFETVPGVWRVVVRHDLPDDNGWFLHIYSAANLQSLPGEEAHG